VDVELRQSLWKFVRSLNREGHTIVLTTHYLEEAELLCGRIAMLKAGRIVALDSTRNLLENFSGLHLKLRLDRLELPTGFFPGLLSHADDLYTIKLADYAELEGVLARLREAGVVIKDFELQPPDLEEVFMRIMNKSE
jgi:ABC-2 type transport system ATP-binding protein